MWRESSGGTPKYCKAGVFISTRGGSIVVTETSFPRRCGVNWWRISIGGDRFFASGPVILPVPWIIESCPLQSSLLTLPQCGYCSPTPPVPTDSATIMGIGLPSVRCLFPSPGLLTTAILPLMRPNFSLCPILCNPPPSQTVFCSGSLIAWQRCGRSTRGVVLKQLVSLFCVLFLTRVIGKAWYC